MTVRKFTLTLLLSIVYNALFSQNLVPNPSFEDENICKKYHENCSPAAWRSTTLKQFLYPEYLPSERRLTAIKPPDGVRFIGLRFFNTKRKFDRSIVQVPLLCSLEKGKKYKVSFDYLSSIFWINSFHIQFVDSLKIHKNNKDLVQTSSSITIEFQKSHQRKKWLSYEIIYEAKGNEVGFILGNLKTDDETQVHLFEKKKDKNRTRVYYYFDNFSIIPIEKDSLCNLEKNQTFIYKDSIRHLPNGTILDITMQKTTKQVVDLSTAPITIEQKKITAPPIIESEISVEEIFTMSNILFEINSENLLPIAHTSLNELVSFLKKNTHLNVRITGHTDNVGNEKSNLELSQKRAKSVANFLTQKGVIPTRIITNGKGESQPITENNTPFGRSQNRRVEFQLRTQ